MARVYDARVARVSVVLLELWLSQRTLEHRPNFVTFLVKRIRDNFVYIIERSSKLILYINYNFIRIRKYLN